VLVLNPRSGSAQAVREQLLAAAGRYGIQLHEAETPAELVALARAAVANGADVLGVAGGDGSLAAVAAVAIEAELPSCVSRPALVHEPSYRDNQLRALSGVLESMLQRDALPVRVSFRDGAGNRWDQVLVLFVSNNAYPLTGLGGRPRLDAGMLEISALRRTEGQELGRAPENLVNSRYQAGHGWAGWATTQARDRRPQRQAGGRHRRGAGGRRRPDRVQDPRGRAARAAPSIPAGIRGERHLNEMPRGGSSSAGMARWSLRPLLNSLLVAEGRLCGSVPPLGEA
jgi:hypothetical protein